MTENIRPIVVCHPDGFTHVEMHDDFGFTGIQPSEMDIILATEENVYDLEEEGEYHVPPREIIKMFQSFRNSTEVFYDKLINTAHEGAGATRSNGGFVIPKIENIDPIDREAYFVIYEDQFPKSALLKQMKKRDSVS